MVEPESPTTTEPQDLISLVRSPGAPRELRRFAAQGLLPLERDDRMRALLAVVGDDDPEVGGPATETLRRIPPDDLVRFLEEGEPIAAELDAITRNSEDPFVLERVIRNRVAADETLLRLARTAAGPPQDALIVNQVRLIRQPALIDALLDNPNLAADGRRRLLELREEFFDKKARRKEKDRLRKEEEERVTAMEAAGVVFEEGQEGAAEALPGEGAADGQDAGAETELSSAGLAAVYRRIAVMTVKERVEIAQRGTKEERRILIADANKIVSLAVLRCETLTPVEVAGFCSMRHLHAEVFQEIAASREWIRRPKIQLSLVTNPAVPLSITLPLIKYLGMRDLRILAHDRNLPEGVRVAARKVMFEKRR